MEDDEGSGVTGVFITLILYTATSIITLLILYGYLLYVHLNGRYASCTCSIRVYSRRTSRMLDLYRRLNASANEFLIPNDYEVCWSVRGAFCQLSTPSQVSMSEVRSLCNRAELWRGPLGESRRVIVSTFTEKDANDPTFEARHTHIAIYELQSKEKLLYRHWLGFPDGMLVEVFDNLSTEFGSHLEVLERMLGSTAFSEELKRKGFFTGLDRL
jgi:antitoxin component HigA of HigAB toxin-antitoxin module